MERRPAGSWINILRVGLTVSLFVLTFGVSNSQPLRLIRCVFMVRSNVTCFWETGDTAATSYTLQVQKISGKNVTFTCNTSGSSCTAGINNSCVRFKFCISVIAHTGKDNVSSEPQCHDGRNEAVFSAPILKKVEPVHGSPECLSVSWSRDRLTFPVSDSEIKAGDLNYQIKFDTQEQSTLEDFEANVTIISDKLYSFRVCFFRPDTQYSIRLRSRYQVPASPWSLWSDDVQGRTAEGGKKCPGVAVQQPLPHCKANGQVVRYNVTCQTENAHVLSDHGSCNNLRPSRSNCSLSLPAGRYLCNLTASTSAGTSPAAQIWISDSSETDLQPLSQFTVSPLGDFKLEVNWTSPPNLSVNGFVVEWFAVREQSSSVLYWEKLNSSCTKLLIIEGVKPMERYAVSVKALYGEQEGGGTQTHIYTREGTPSAAPEVRVQNIYSNSVEVSWTCPPVENLHGFINKYTIFYSTTNQPAKSVFVPGHVLHYTLENMPPGTYNISMRVSTAIGTSPAGTNVTVQIRSEEVSLYIYVLVPFILILLMLILVAFLTQMQMMTQKLCQSIPDPSNSTLSHWTPSTGFETKKLILTQEKPEISYTEVILLDQMKDLDESSISQLLLVDLSYYPVQYDPYIPYKG